MVRGRLRLTRAERHAKKTRCALSGAVKDIKNRPYMRPSIGDEASKEVFKETMCNLMTVKKRVTAHD